MDIVRLEYPAIPLLGIYPEDVPTGKKDTCSTMFIAALFIIAISWKVPRCPPTPPTEEWIQKMWYIYTMVYYSGAACAGPHFRHGSTGFCHSGGGTISPSVAWHDREVVSDG